MKKLILTFFVFIFSINIAYGGSCRIKDKEASVLSEWIKNNEKILSKIQNWTTNTDSSNYPFKEEATKIVWWFNKLFSFDANYSTFKYYVVFPISYEVPKEVKRDYKLIEKEINKIEKKFKQTIENSAWNKIIENPCSWIKWRCNFPNKIKAEDLLVNTLKNAKQILTYYTNLVVWDDYKSSNLTLVSNNFENEMKSHYWKVENSSCNEEEEWGFFQRITESIEEIWNLQKQAKDWLKKWQEAWNLLMERDEERQTYQEKEKNLLQKELSKQWISSSNKENMLNALEKYNSEWFSMNNNFVYNTYNNAKTKIENSVKKIKNEFIKDFLNTEQKTKDEVQIKNTSISEESSKTTLKIKEEIDSLYFKQKDFDAVSEMNTHNLMNRIIESHIFTSNNIETLKETCKKAVDLCNRQDTWNWNCGKCN